MNAEHLKQLASLAQTPRVQALLDALGDEAQLHLVGGSVRDSLLGRESFDLDFASALTPDALLERLTQANLRVIPTGLQHQTVTAVPIPGEAEVEITSFRSAGMSPTSGLVFGESIEEDLRFRDFTINALAYCLSTKELIDPCNGQEDILARRIRAVRDARTRFEEDPLRILRMVRFACLPEFTLDSETKEASREFAAKIPAIAPERIRVEFSKILTSARADEGLGLLEELGFLRTFLPELSDCVDFEQNEFHPDAVFEHTLVVIMKTKPELRLRLAALFHDIGKPPTLSVDEEGRRHFYRHETVGAEMASEILSRLRYSNKLREEVVTLVRTHMRPITAGMPGLRRLLRDTEDVYEDWRELKEADASSVLLDPQQLNQELADFDLLMEEVKKGPNVSPLKNLAIAGADLIALGLTPGPRFGEILRALHERVLDDPELNTKDTLLNFVKETESL